jgi:thioredoxin-like negative regulator of GroEL
MMKKAFILTAITALLSSNVAFAEDNKVIDLTKEDLSNILRTDSNVVINFYEDDCAECEDLNPVFEDAATNFKGEAKFAKFNCNNEETFCATYGAFGMPKVRAFKNGSPSKLYEDDEPNVDTLLQFMDR